MSNLTIGLFGTCGNSTWRNEFIKEYEKENINYYNPQVKDWKPEYSIEEAKHLATDKIIIFPITSETYGEGSLSEVGFSILNAIRLDNTRYFIILIDDYLNDNLKDTLAREQSLRMRQLVRSHLLEQNLDNLYFVNTLDEMLKVSKVIYKSELIKQKVDKYKIKNGVS